MVTNKRLPTQGCENNEKQHGRWRMHTICFTLNVTKRIATVDNPVVAPAATDVDMALIHIHTNCDPLQYRCKLFLALFFGDFLFWFGVDFRFSQEIPLPHFPSTMIDQSRSPHRLQLVA